MGSGGLTMPRLLLFGVCQKAIMDRQSSLVSMIEIISRLQLIIPAGNPLPADTIGPVQWGTAASLLPEDGDEGKVFQTQVEIFSPSGEKKIEIPGEPFTAADRAVQTITNAFGFPIGEAGVYSIKLFLREVSKDDWKEIFNYPLEVIYTEQKGEEDEADAEQPEEATA